MEPKLEQRITAILDKIDLFYSQSENPFEHQERFYRLFKKRESISKHAEVNVSAFEINEEENESFFEEIPKRFLEDLFNYLKNNPVFLYEYESIILNCDIVPIWNYIINETNFDQNFLITNKKEYHSELKKVGDTFLYKLNENEFKIAKVTKIDRDFVKKQWTFLFNLYNSKDDDNVECEVSFFLLITKQNNIFLSYHHDFKTPIEQSELNNLAKDKKKFLNEIKNYFEK